MKVNQLKAGVVLSYASQAIGILISLLYTPVMLRLLGQSEYGLFQLAGSTISYLSLLSLGFGASYVRYYSRYKVANDNKSIAKLNGMFMTIFIVIGIIALFAGSVLIANVENMFKNSLTPDEINTARILMMFMVFNLAMTFPESVFSSHITANEQYLFQRIVGMITQVLSPMITLPLLLMGYKSIGLVTVQTAFSIASFAINWIFCKKKLGMEFDFKNFEWKFLKSLFMFSFWIFLNNVIDQINWSVDKFVLGIVSGTTTVAVYGIAGTLNRYYVNFSIAISDVFTPKINRMVAQTNDNKQLTDLFARVGRIQFIILMLVITGLVIFGKYFINAWAGEEYNEAYRIALLLTIPATIPLIQNLGLQIQRAKNLHRYRSIVYAIIAVLNIIVSIPLAKLYGGTGAAIGTAASLLLGNGFIMNWMYQKIIGLDIMYFWKQIAKFIPALIIPAICGFLIIKFVTFPNLFIYMGLILAYTVVYCCSMWFLGMNRYERELIAQPVKRILGRKSNDTNQG